MADQVDLTMTFLPVGDTQAGELADLAAKVRHDLESLPEVERIDRVAAAAPKGAMKGEGVDFGALAAKIAPGAIGKVLNLIVGVLSRSGAPPAKVKLVDGKRQVELEFDPRTISPAEMADLVTQLGGGQANG